MNTCLVLLGHDLQSDSKWFDVRVSHGFTWKRYCAHFEHGPCGVEDVYINHSRSTGSSLLHYNTFLLFLKKHNRNIHVFLSFPLFLERNLQTVHVFKKPLFPSLTVDRVWSLSYSLSLGLSITITT